MMNQSMSARSSVSAGSPLNGPEGPLVSVSIDIDRRDLESLLETLANIGFPINPQIYHDACFIYWREDGSKHIETVTLVEFPAYAGQLDYLREALRAADFDPEKVAATGMLDALRSENLPELTPPGSLYRTRQRCRNAESSRFTGRAATERD